MSVERIEVPASPEVLAEWQSHFAKGANPAEWLTASEIAKAAGVPRTTMSQRLCDGVRAGVYVADIGYRTDLVGRTNPVTVYKLAKKPKRGKK